MRLFEGTPFDRPPHCENCGELESDCRCPPPAEVRTLPGKQTLKLAVERRKGKKLVTTIRGLADEGTHLTEVLSELKTTCGAGGSVQDEVLELQGDQVEAAKSWLQKHGYRVR